jgi:hypothetical protein
MWKLVQLSLDDFKMVLDGGIEPPFSEYETVVLPLTLIQPNKMVRVGRIELPSPVWQTGIINPIYYTRIWFWKKDSNP